MAATTALIMTGLKFVGTKIAASAIGKAVAGVGAKIASSAAVKGIVGVAGKVGSALGKVGTAIKGSKIGTAVVKGATAIGKSKVGAAVTKGAKAVSGFSKSHNIASSLGETLVSKGMDMVSDANQQAASAYSTFGKALTIGSEDDTVSKLTTAAQNSRIDAYNNSVFGTSMSFSNTFAGESGGSGIFSSLLKSKNTLN